MVRSYLERTSAALWSGASATYYLIQSLIPMMMMQMEERILLPQSDTSPLPQREHKSAAPKGQKSAASKRPKFVATTKDPKD
jgi:hypothetical protein